MYKSNASLSKDASKRSASYHAEQAKKHQTCAFGADSASAAE